MSCLKSFKLAVCAALLMGAGTASAALFDRGGGLLYDDVLNVTWLQDANYAKTSGYDGWDPNSAIDGISADGDMNWASANTWAATLVYGGYDDWRLARNTPVGADWNYSSSIYGGTNDLGYNITSPHSELAYMYHVNLGLKGLYSTDGSSQSDWGIFGNGTYGVQNDVGLVRNLQGYRYWSGTEYAEYTPLAFNFHTGNGRQDALYKASHFSWAWAVRDGDVAAPIPEPEIYAMMGIGLGLLGWVGRRRKQQAVE